MEFETRFFNLSHSCHIQRRTSLYKNLSSRKKFFFNLVIISAKHPYHKKYMQCDNDLYFEKYRQVRSDIWYVMHPFSILAASWDLLMSFIYILDLYNVPFWKDEEKALTNFTQYFTYMYVVKQFFTGYVDVENMTIVLNFKQVAVNYLCGWFTVDTLGCVYLSIIPSTCCALAGYDVDEDTRYFFGFGDISNILVLRLFLKSIRLSSEFLIQKESIKRLVVVLFAILTAVHWTTCMTVYVPLCLHGNKLNETGSWLNLQRSVEHKKPMDLSYEELYMEALARTLMQMMLLGLGGPAPRTREDIYLVIITVVLGRLLFYYVIEQALSINNWVQSSIIKFHVMTHLARGCLQKRRVSEVIRDKVELFCQRILQGAPNQLALVGILSSSLREELQKYDTMRVVKGSPILRSLKATTLERVARFLKQEVFLPNEALTRLGGPVDCIYFLESGTVAVYERNGQEACHLADGTCFGTLEFISGHERRILSIVAIEVCEVYRLNADEFNRMLRSEPNLLTTLITMTEKRLGHQIERVAEDQIRM